MLTPENSTKLAIVDDHPIIIHGLRALLDNRSQITVSGCFTTGHSFMDFLSKNPVDIVLLDITLPDTNGLELCKEIKRCAPLTSVLAISNHSERSIILQMLQNGASGYLLKNASAEELLQSIQEALNGQLTFSNEVREIMGRPSLQDLKGIPRLTKREKEILKLIADGETTITIAGQLFLSPLTIETHRRNLMQKFGVKNVAAMIRVAGQNHLL